MLESLYLEEAAISIFQITVIKIIAAIVILDAVINFLKVYNINQTRQSYIWLVHIILKS
jgi:hypothetical protein